MSRRAKVEELADNSEIFDDDTDLPLPSAPLVSSQQSSRATDNFEQMQVDPQPGGQSPSQIKYMQDQGQFKDWQCLYPIYYDNKRSIKEGRRVKLAEAVENPLAKAIADGCRSLGLNVVFEPIKSHPADWANPGRVRVQFKVKGVPQHPSIRTKHSLDHAVSQYLRDHPTTEEDPFKVPVPGLPSDKPPPPPAVPRGFKMNKILPLHSPALTGGGVNENMLQDVMKEGGLQNLLGGMGGMGGMGGADAGRGRGRGRVR